MVDGGASQWTTSVLSGGHLLRFHASVSNASSPTEVGLDALTRTDSLGTSPISSLDIGVRTTGPVLDLALDDAVVTRP